MTKNKRTTLHNVVKGQYFQLFSFLFEEPYSSGLSSHAKLLYALINNRTNLSRQNNWINQAGEVYTIFTRVEIGRLLGISVSSATKVVRELIRFGLLEEEISQGHASRFFLLAPENLLHTNLPQFVEHKVSSSQNPQESDTYKSTSCCAAPVNSMGGRRKIYGGTPVISTAEYNNNKNISQREYQSIDQEKDDRKHILPNFTNYQSYYLQKLEEIDADLETCYNEQNTLSEENYSQLSHRIARLHQQRAQYRHLQVDYSLLPLCEVEDRVREQIEYDAITGPQGTCETERELVDSVVSVISEDLHKNKLDSANREKLLHLSAEQVALLVESVRSYTKPIRNPKKFLERCILNAAASYGIQLTNRIAMIY